LEPIQTAIEEAVTSGDLDVSGDTPTNPTFFIAIKNFEISRAPCNDPDFPFYVEEDDECIATCDSPNEVT